MSSSALDCEYILSSHPMTFCQTSEEWAEHLRHQNKTLTSMLEIQNALDTSAYRNPISHAVYNAAIDNIGL